MAKCPKCEARKGKRHCPALDTLICPQCCAEHRLETIACPQDCVHLESETYQLARRRQKAQSRGRSFVQNLKELFRNEESRRFGFLLQADVYWWMARNGRLTNEACASAYADIKSRLSAVYVPSAAPKPLVEFLFDLLHKGKRHRRSGNTFTDKHRRDVLDALARHVRSLGEPAGYSYHQEIDAYFGQLDFEADLDYSPSEELGTQPQEHPAGFREGSSGLILPGN